jgi:hypothetical protein
MILNLNIMLLGLGDSMQCKLDLIILTKIKEMIRYYELFGHDSKTLSTSLLTF